MAPEPTVPYRYYLGGRGAGKTHQLLDWLAEAPAHRSLIAPSGTMAADSRRRLMDRVPSLTLYEAAKHVVSPDEVRNGILRGRADEVAVDEMGLLCMNMFGVRPVVVSDLAVPWVPKGDGSWERAW